MAKGGGFEIEVCRDLSNWWSGGESTDWFWRASQSGGRATTNAKKGQTATGHYGDIAACCPEADILTRFITFEAKRGYNKTADIHDLLDQTEWITGTNRKSRFVGFIEQAIAAAIRAHTPYWALIHRRDRCEAMIYIPRGLADCLLIGKSLPRRVYLSFKPNPPMDPPFTGKPIMFVGIPLATFFEEVENYEVKKLIRRIA